MSQLEADAVSRIASETLTNGWRARAPGNTASCGDGKGYIHLNYGDNMTTIT